MIRHLKAISKQLFGAKYEQLTKSIFYLVVLYLSLYLGEIRIKILPFFLFMPAFVFSATVMLKSLSSMSRTQRFQGLFLLPYKNKELMGAYCMSFTLHTIITKTALLLSVLFAVKSWSPVEMILALLNAVLACFLVTIFVSSEKLISKVGVSVCSVVVLAMDYLIPVYELTLGLTIVFCILSWMILCQIKVEHLYCPYQSRKHSASIGGKGSMVRYLNRYLCQNKVYLVNWLFLLGIAVFLPVVFGEVKEIREYAMTLSLAILCVNTPMGTVLSSSRGLEKAVRILPRQERKFVLSYWTVLLIYNVPTYLINLASWQITYHCVQWSTVWIAGILLLQSLLLTVFIEWNYPLTEWKVETDLWHHPRKYIIPVVMMVYAGLCLIHPIIMVILTLAVAAEYIYYGGRILNRK